MGRPSKGERVTITVYVTKPEHTTIKQVAKAREMTMSDYLVECGIKRADRMTYQTALDRLSIKSKTPKT